MIPVVVLSLWALSAQSAPYRTLVRHFDAPVPPVLAWPNQGRLYPAALFEEHALSGAVSVSVDPSRVTIRWVHGRFGQTWTAWQREATPYWPTAAAVVGDSLVVAGKRRGLGFRTVIEKWSLEYPSAIPDPLVEAFEVSIEKQVLFDANVVGKRTVRMMQGLHGHPGAEGGLLVHFADSNDLYVLEIASCSLSPLYASTAVPALAKDSWRYIWSGEHPSAGYVYVYQGDLDGAVLDPLVLLDGDKDGTIDEWRQLSESAWETMLGDPTTWTKVF